MENYEPIAEESDNNLSDSSDGEDIIENNMSKGYNKPILNLLENRNLNIQDLLSYFADEKLKEKKESNLIESVEEPNLCIK
jgi:hypothetical protein